MLMIRILVFLSVIMALAAQKASAQTYSYELRMANSTCFQTTQDTLPSTISSAQECAIAVKDLWIANGAQMYSEFTTFMWSDALQNCRACGAPHGDGGLRHYTWNTFSLLRDGALLTQPLKHYMYRLAGYTGRCNTTQIMNSYETRQRCIDMATARGCQYAHWRSTPGTGQNLRCDCCSNLIPDHDQTDKGDDFTQFVLLPSQECTALAACEAAIQCSGPNEQSNAAGTRCCLEIGNATEYGDTCEVRSCEDGFAVSPDQQRCCEKLTSGIDTFDNDCRVTKCDNGYTLKPDGSGCCLEVANATAYDDNCQVASCAQGYGIQPNANGCCLNQSAGITSFTDQCEVSSCADGYAETSDKQRCCEKQTSGIDTFDNVCRVSACHTGFIEKPDADGCCQQVTAGIIEVDSACGVVRCDNGYTLKPDGLGCCLESTNGIDSVDNECKVTSCVDGFGPTPNGDGCCANSTVGITEFDDLCRVTKCATGYGIRGAQSDPLIPNPFGDGCCPHGTWEGIATFDAVCNVSTCDPMYEPTPNGAGCCENTNTDWGIHSFDDACEVASCIDGFIKVPGGHRCCQIQAGVDQIDDDCRVSRCSDGYGPTPNSQGCCEVTNVNMLSFDDECKVTECREQTAGIATFDEVCRVLTCTDGFGLMPNGEGCCRNNTDGINSFDAECHVTSCVDGFGLRRGVNSSTNNNSQEDQEGEESDYYADGCCRVPSEGVDTFNSACLVHRCQEDFTKNMASTQCCRNSDGVVDVFDENCLPVTLEPTPVPTLQPTQEPTLRPTQEPTLEPSQEPTPTTSPEPITSAPQATRVTLDNTLGDAGAGFISAVNPIGGASTLYSQRLRALSGDCDGRLEEIPRWDVAPVGEWPIGHSYYRNYAGGVAFALILYTGVIMVHFLCAGLYARIKADRTFKSVLHTSKVSLMITTLTMIVAEPIGQLGVVGVTQGGSAEFGICFTGLLLFVAGVAGAFYMTFRRHFVAQLRMFTDDERKAKKNCLARGALPKGEWMVDGGIFVEDIGDKKKPAEMTRSEWWMSMAAPLFIDYSERFRYWMMVEVCVSFFLGVSEALMPIIGCIACTAMMFCVLLVHTVLVFTLRPFLIPIDQALNMFVSPIMSCAGLLKLIFVIKNDEGLADTMEMVVVFMSMVLIIRSLFDLFNLMRKAFSTNCFKSCGLRHEAKDVLLLGGGEQKTDPKNQDEMTNEDDEDQILINNIILGNNNANGNNNNSEAGGENKHKKGRDSDDDGVDLANLNPSKSRRFTQIKPKGRNRAQSHAFNMSHVTYNEIEAYIDRDALCPDDRSEGIMPHHNKKTTERGVIVDNDGNLVNVGGGNDGSSDGDGDHDDGVDGSPPSISPQTTLFAASPSPTFLMSDPSDTYTESQSHHHDQPGGDEPEGSGNYRWPPEPMSTDPSATWPSPMSVSLPLPLNSSPNRGIRSGDFFPALTDQTSTDPSPADYRIGRQRRSMTEIQVNKKNNDELVYTTTPTSSSAAVNITTEQERNRNNNHDQKHRDGLYLQPQNTFASLDVDVDGDHGDEPNNGILQAQDTFAYVSSAHDDDDEFSPDASSSSSSSSRSNFEEEGSSSSSPSSPDVNVEL